MRVIKRNGDVEEASFDKVLRRIETLAEGLPRVDHVSVAQKVVAELHDGVRTADLDEHAASLCATLVTTDEQYGQLASRLVVSNCHKNTAATFSEAIARLHGNVGSDGSPAPLVTDLLRDIVAAHGPEIDARVQNERDQLFDYFGFKTLERGYLLRGGPANAVVERPQYMWMRVALGIHEWDLPNAFRTYDLMSTKRLTHATPTLYNAGTPTPQLSSCYLMHAKDDSVEGIYETLKACALISKYAGGIGLSVHNIRATGSRIKGTNGTSTGLVPMLRNFNATARYINQGGRRPGSVAIYLEPHHADIFQWLDLRKNNGNEEERARDLFYGLWVSDLFMRRVEADAAWSLMCPSECPGLHDVFGEAFDRLYEGYEAQGRYRKQVPARDVWKAIINAQIETGTPYILYKDAANRKSNQSNLGTIKSSNLCAEIIEYTDAEEVAVCNLASISLPAFVTESGYDFEALHETAKVAVFNLNRVIDRTFYPVPEARRSNTRHRPIGVGVQGLADVYADLRMPFDSEEAAALNRRIFETIYHACVESSCEIAEADGPYASFHEGGGCPASHGRLQFDLWGVQPEAYDDWDALRARAARGMRNSLLVALMPTASTSQILGNTESIEPITSNIYQRKTLAGNFVLVNKRLVRDLRQLGLWGPEMKNRIIRNGGSVQGISEIPEDVKRLYKTVWEIKQRALIQQAADRGPFVCQSQSLNLYSEGADRERLTNRQFFAWKAGLKTGVYYTRCRPLASAQQFTVDPDAAVQPPPREGPGSGAVGRVGGGGGGLVAVGGGGGACRRDDPACLSCGS